jgi:hypothetical protein
MNLANDRINSLEQDLERSLRPVQPNPEFVNRLHDRLVTPAGMVVESRRSPAYSLGAFLVGIGLAVGLFLVWVIRQLR